MIYLDNAATTYPKPQQVYSAWTYAISAYGANPGRAGHQLSQKTAAAVFSSREKCAEFFGCDTENTVFTLNCTQALNFAIKGLAKHGAHYVTSDMEHNAVIRPVNAAAEHSSGSFSLFEVSEDDRLTVRNAENALKPNTAAVVFTAASNVTGKRLPVRALAEMCRRHGVCCITDAAQAGGVLPVSMKDGVNFICAAGHKGLYGPMGTGLMLTDGQYQLDTIIEGGTGSMSESLSQPEFLPDRFESGTINTAGVIALGAGVDFVRRRTTDAIYNHEMNLCLHLCEELKKMPHITVYGGLTESRCTDYAPVLSFNAGDAGSAETAQRLSDSGFYMRGGLHCAPLAHRKIGTLERGTVRFSPSIFTTHDDVNRLVKKLYREK